MLDESLTETSFEVESLYEKHSIVMPFVPPEFDEAHRRTVEELSRDQ